jgi:hypothetical protein
MGIEPFSAQPNLNVLKKHTQLYSRVSFKTLRLRSELNDATARGCGGAPADPRAAAGDRGELLLVPRRVDRGQRQAHVLAWGPQGPGVRGVETMVTSVGDRQTPREESYGRR